MCYKKSSVRVRKINAHNNRENTSGMVVRQSLKNWLEKSAQRVITTMLSWVYKRVCICGLRLLPNISNIYKGCIFFLWLNEILTQTHSPASLHTHRYILTKIQQYYHMSVRKKKIL